MSLFLGDLKSEDGIDLWNEWLALTSLEEDVHHSEDGLRDEAGLGSRWGCGLGGSSFLGSLDVVHDDGHHFLGRLRIRGTGRKIANFRPILGNGFWRKSLDIELVASGPLPSLSGGIASSNLEQGTVVLAALVAKICDERSNISWAQGFKDLLRHDGGSHTSTSKWGNAVALDVSLLALLGKSLRETPETELSGGIVSLSERTVDTTGAASVDDSTILLFSHDVPCSSGNRVGTLEVDLHDQIPIEFSHLLERDISENTSIVHDNVDSAKGIDGSLHDLVSKLN